MLIRSGTDGNVEYRGFCGATTHQVSTFNLQAHMKASMKYIISVDMPFSIGEHIAHQEYARSLCPQYQPMSKATTRNDLIEYYNRRMATLQEELEKITFHVAFTFDVQSEQDREDYISIVILHRQRLDFAESYYRFSFIRCFPH